MPFLHDHVIGDVRSRNHGDDRGNNRVRYHAFFVLCSAQGISSGGCVPTMTSIPGVGTIPLAKTVNGHNLTSVDPIESPANAALLTLLDTECSSPPSNPGNKTESQWHAMPIRGPRTYERQGPACSIFLFNADS